MMKKVEAGLIKRVIVKDMSRFGRNYLEVGYYTEVIFPEYDVQFIAVNDNVDSEVQTDNDFTPFRNIMNEWYAKDISKKMKSAIKAKGNSGKHTNPLPPYGYIKDPNDKNKWLIDEEAATVVRRIFGLCMQGFGPTQISRILTDEGVDTPKIHAKKMGRKVTITAFAREHESEFLDLAKKRSLRETEKLRAENKASLDKAVRRIAEIDGIIQKLYEDNVSGKISDERFAKMTATYETEQNGLQQTAQRLKDEISAVREEGESVDRFMKLVNKYSDITELNAEIIRTFVEKIIVYEAEKIDGVKTQRVKIVYNCVGTVSVPNADNEPVKTDKTKIIEVA